jgi:septal ring factor EnvC (AmiA/AmiB activator)
MKSSIAVAVLFSILVIGCDQGKQEEMQQQISQLQSERMTLHENLTERDKYFEEVVKALNEVYADIEKTRAKEAKLVKGTGGSEVPLQITNAETRQNLLKNISEIGTVLKANRKRVSDLQARMKSFQGEIAGLNKLVENLKKTLEEREQSIALLQGRVQGLEATVAENTRILAEKDGMLNEQQRQLSTGYFIIGTRSELEEKGVIRDEGGFLWFGATTVMSSDVDRSLFTPIDKTKEQTISVEGEIDEILPRRNDQVFATAHQAENATSLTIVRPEKFWQDNYLVIVVD